MSKLRLAATGCQKPRQRRARSAQRAFGSRAGANQQQDNDQQQAEQSQPRGPSGCARACGGGARREVKGERPRRLGSGEVLGHCPGDDRPVGRTQTVQFRLGRQGYLALEFGRYSPRVRADAASAKLELASAYHRVRLPDGQSRDLPIANGQVKANVRGICEPVT
jgi:hypothetical protein